MEKVISMLDDRQPTGMPEEIVNLVRNDKLLWLHPAGFAQCGNKFDCLGEIHLSIIISLDQQDRGLPVLHGADGRRSKGEISARSIGARRCQIGKKRLPI